jgi:adenosylhomocysteine nucleosidase
MRAGNASFSSDIVKILRHTWPIIGALILSSALPPSLVVVALMAESAGVFEAAGVPIVHCGVGKINAAVTLTRELVRYEHQGRPMPLVVNFGSVGSDRFPTGALVGCHEFVQRDMDARALGFALGETPFDDGPPTISFERVFSTLPEAVCGSGDSFASAAVEMACGVVDMEAYALAKVCRSHGAAFACAKYVTDGMNPGSADEWQQNVHRAAEEFLRLFRTL